MLSEPMDAYIDSTIPQIWLPLDACRQFEDAFGLVYDATTELYLVNDSLHDQLVDQNPNVTFTLGLGPSGGETVDIVFPYASFDLTALSPYQGLANQSRYFPLRRAANQTQYTLGRTFLQEAYLMVDWENGNFSVSQCIWPNQMSKNIIAMQPPTNGQDASNYQVGIVSPSSLLSTGAIVGIAIGVVAVVGILLLILALYYRHRRHQRSAKNEEKKELQATEKPDSDQVLPKAELPAVEPVTRNGKNKVQHVNEPNPFDDPSNLGPSSSMTPSTPGSPGTGFFTPYRSRSGILDLSTPSTPNEPVEVDNKEREIYEMPGDAPTRQEMDAPAVGEKQAMMMRERIYNGIDPLPSPTSGNGRDSLSNRGSNTFRSSNVAPSPTSVYGRDSVSNRESNTYRSSTLAPSPVHSSDIVSPISYAERRGHNSVQLEDRGPISPLQPEFSGFRFSFEGQASEPSDVSEPSRTNESGSQR